MKTHTRAAIIQMRSESDKYANLTRARELIAKAASEQAEFIGLPEMFNCLGSYDHMVASAEKIPGNTTNWICDLAREHRVYIHGGSIYEKIENSNRIYNTSVIVAPSGDILTKYRKIHLFDVDLQNDFSSRESKWVAPGENVVTLETLFGTIGMAICYDLRFPELFRQLADKGAQLIFVPSAFRSTTGAAHWEVLLRARAIENQVYVLASNQWGEHKGEVSNYGNSMVVNPWGEVIARAGSKSDSILAVDINLADLEKIRTCLPALKHRRIHSS